MARLATAIQGRRRLESFLGCRQLIETQTPYHCIFSPYTVLISLVKTLTLPVQYPDTMGQPLPRSRPAPHVGGIRMPVSHSTFYIVLSDKFHPRPQKLGHGSTHRSCRSGSSHGSLSVCVPRKMEGWSISHIRSRKRKRHGCPAGSASATRNRTTALPGTHRPHTGGRATGSISNMASFSACWLSSSV
jgi:hypothetical protein